MNYTPRSSAFSLPRGREGKTTKLEKEEPSWLVKQREQIKREYLEPLRVDFMSKRANTTEQNRPRPNGQFHRDYTRIMYSSSFRRLQGKMQMLGIKNDQFFRNRLTHSLEVAQIARSIAEILQYDPEELYVVEAGALAHDLGNPPFGHAGERYLNELFHDVGGFEGNAQTLRKLTTIEKKRPDFQGLNLTYRSLLAVVKYFHKFDRLRDDGQKFIYDDDYEMLQKKLQKEEVQGNKITLRTLDVQIVDIADEIAYAAHDLEDGLRVKAYTIDEILHDFRVAYGREHKGCYRKLENIVEDVRRQMRSGNGVVESSQYSKLFRQELSSRLINLAINDLGLVKVDPDKAAKTGTSYENEIGFTQYEMLFHGLKEIVFKCINHNDEVYHYEQKGRQVIRFLGDLYTSEVKYLPPEYRAEELMKQYKELKTKDKDRLQQRLACDYIAGMMDSYAISVYEKYSGRRFDAMDMHRIFVR